MGTFTQGTISLFLESSGLGYLRIIFYPFLNSCFPHRDFNFENYVLFGEKIHFSVFLESPGQSPILELFSLTPQDESKILQLSIT